MRSEFDCKIQDLIDDLISMGAMIETAISRAITALKTGDVSLAKEVMASDIAVDDLELQIERKALNILLTQQPVAKDLRLISTALKVITDMERISDQSVDIAEIVITLPHDSTEYPQKIITMAQKCVMMVSASVHAFIESDVETADEIIASDDEIDLLFEEVKEELIKIIREDAQGTQPVLDYLMIAKYLERIGDHSTNIAEWVQFSVTGNHKNQRIL